MERQDESTTGCRARPMDEQDVRRRAQSVARRTGGGRSSLFPSRIPRSLRCLNGWRKLSPSFSRKPLTWQVWCAMAVEMTRLGHPLLSIMVLLSVECYLRSIGGSEPHRSKPASSGNQCSPTLGRALIPAGEQTTVQSWGRGRHSGDRLWTGKLDAKSLSGVCEPTKVPTAVPDRLPVVPRGIPESDQQHWDRSGALPDAAFRAFAGPRSGKKVHYFLPKAGTLGNNDESQEIRKARTPQRHMEASFARNPSVLPHVRARRRGLHFGRKNMPFATEVGRKSSKPLAEISRQPQIASSSRLFEYRARHWQIFESATDRWRFVRDRLRQRDISGFYLCWSRVAKTLQVLSLSLSALSRFAVDLRRMPSAFLWD